jgi:MSHA pilin protein MshD
MTDAAAGRSQHGFTLIELIVFIVIVSAGLAGILAVMNTVVKSSGDPMLQKQAIAVAESLLEEILLKNYSNPVGRYSGTSRDQFDDVGDYANYSTSGGIVDASGVPIAGLESYNVQPAVTVVSSSDLNGVAAFKVTVSVTGPAGVASLSGYRGNDQGP